MMQPSIIGSQPSCEPTRVYVEHRNHLYTTSCEVFAALLIILWYCCCDLRFYERVHMPLNGAALIQSSRLGAIASTPPPRSHYQPVHQLLKRLL